MEFKPTPSGGRIVQGDTPYGRFRVEWDTDGRLVSEKVEMREPAPAKSRGLGDTISKATKAMGVKECGGCRKRRRLLNRWIPYPKRKEASES